MFNREMEIVYSRINKKDVSTLNVGLICITLLELDQFGTNFLGLAKLCFANLNKRKNRRLYWMLPYFERCLYDAYKDRIRCAIRLPV